MNFCEMLWVNLELLPLLKILMTALLDKVPYSTLSLFTQESAEVYKSVPSTYCWGVTLQWTSIMSRGE